MRLSKIFAPILAAVTVAGSAIDSSLTKRVTVAADVCVELDLNLLAALNAALGINLIAVIGVDIDVCLCVSAVASFVKGNAIAQLAVLLVGEAKVEAAITSLINSHSPSHCTYPDNCVPLCAKGNVCGFNCKPPYVKSPDGKKCVLPPSGKAKRGYFEQVMAAESGCRYGQEVCPIWGRAGQAFECVDVKNDLFSCGGCITPPGDHYHRPQGVDCSAIQGVSDVGCVAGVCQVKRCVRGWELGANQTSCEPSRY